MLHERRHALERQAAHGAVRLQHAQARDARRRGGDLDHGHAGLEGERDDLRRTPAPLRRLTVPDRQQQVALAQHDPAHGLVAPRAQGRALLRALRSQLQHPARPAQQAPEGGQAPRIPLEVALDVRDQEGHGRVQLVAQGQRLLGHQLVGPGRQRRDQRQPGRRLRVEPKTRRRLRDRATQALQHAAHGLRQRLELARLQRNVAGDSHAQDTRRRAGDRQDDVHDDAPSVPDDPPTLRTT
jgi:hypothetical protein